VALGDSPYDRELQQAWGAFCDRLKSAGDLVFKDSNPATALQRVDGFRYLAQNLSQAFDLSLETKNTQYPALLAFDGPTRKLGSDNADCIYLQAWIDGDTVYKISGRRGSARMSNFSVQGPRSTKAYVGHSRPLHEPFGDTPEANMFGSDLVTNWDGTFELYIGGEKRGPNWLPTTKGSRKLFLRQYFDSFDEEPAEYRIERVGMDGPRPIPTPDEMIAAMQWAGQFVYDVVDYWPEWSWASPEAVDPKALNQFGGRNVTVHEKLSPEQVAMEARRGRLGTQMRWSLANDEALIVEFDHRPEDFWMFTVEANFGNSMDYQYRPVSYSPSRTAVDSDGKIRLIMTANDPGFHNWVDNQGYTAGAVTFRSVQAPALPSFRNKVVKAADLARHLPADTRRCSREERVAQMHRRFDAIRRRYRL
jgi:hypothetical protein